MKFGESHLVNDSFTVNIEMCTGHLASKSNSQVDLWHVRGVAWVMIWGVSCKELARI